MENESRATLVRVLAIFGFALSAINGVFAFGDAGSTSFVQVWFLVILAAMTLTALILTRDAEASMPVIGATALYGGGLILRAIPYLLDRVISFFRTLRLGNLQSSVRYDDLSELEEGDILRKIDRLQQRINRDTIGEILDFLCIAIAVAVAVLAVLMILRLFAKKDFGSSLFGKKVCAMFGAGKKATGKSGKPTGKSAPDAGTPDATDPQQPQNP